jgi:hypothetical protein
MALRASIIALLAALLLAACGTASPGQLATAAPDLPASAQPTQIPQTIIAPGSTRLPTPTQAPAQSTPPEPTQASAPTAIPEPTHKPAQPPAPTQAPAPTNAPAPTVASTGANGELLFLRQSTLLALDLATRKERPIADGVLDFAAPPDGKAFALVRDVERVFELWIVQRDGSGLQQITANGNDRLESTPVWSPDGTALAYAAADTSDIYARTWLEWSAWCVVSEVHVFDLASGADRSFGPGCDPAFSPDSKRIAYATRPSTRQEGSNSPNTTNAIRLINRQGQNGWNFATTDGGVDPASPKRGLLVYAPAFSPDGKQLSYQRFLGYQALVDLDLTEIGGSFEGQGQPLNVGAGWLLPARFSPDGQMVAIVENNFSDARGFGGYDNWSVTVLRLSGTHDVALPTGELKAVGQVAGQLPRAQAAAWSPDRATLAVLLPPGWKPGLPNDQPVDADEKPGEIWSWRPGGDPVQKLAENVDFASPVLWLPATP